MKEPTTSSAFRLVKHTFYQLRNIAWASTSVLVGGPLLRTGTAEGKRRTQCRIHGIVHTGTKQPVHQE